MTERRPEQQGENRPLPGGDEGQIVSRTAVFGSVEAHLEDALCEDTRSMKNYHIRSALQALLIETEDHVD